MSLERSRWAISPWCGGGNCVDTTWQTSQYCGAASCVETGLDLSQEFILMRDTKAVKRGISGQIVRVPIVTYFQHYQPMVAGDVDAADEATWHLLEPLFVWIAPGWYESRNPGEVDGVVLQFNSEEVSAHILGMQDNDYLVNRRLPEAIEKQIISEPMTAA